MGFIICLHLVLDLNDQNRANHDLSKMGSLDIILCLSSMQCQRKEYFDEFFKQTIDYEKLEKLRTEFILI